ncbi:MAG TPA: hypothetical protein VHE37_12100, partial [Nevskiaceae bacterium]|nr:hypothetical protein [Nevskiaceae bacterium]
MSAVTAESNLQLVAQASELMRLAFEIANDSAQSDVECMCHIHSGNADEGWWYELGKPSPE